MRESFWPWIRGEKNSDQGLTYRIRNTAKKMKKAHLGKVDLDAGVVLGCQNPVAGTALPAQNIMSEYYLLR